MAELTVPQINFSALGELPAIYKQGQADVLRQQTLASLGQGGAADANALIRSGDLSLAQLGMNLQNREADQARQARQDAFQREESVRAQKNTDRSYGLQERQFVENQDYTPEELSQRRTAQLKSAGIDPSTPAAQSFMLTGQYDGSASKPIPIETIGGTKFLVRGKDGSLSLIDPSTMAQPSTAPAAAPPAVASSAAPTQQQPSTAPTGGPEPAPQPQSAAPDIDTVDPKSGRREGYLQSLDPQVRDYVRKVADYEIDPRTTSIKGGLREKLLSAVAKYDPTYNQNDFGARAKAIKDFSSGKQGDIVRSFDVAIDHLDTLQRAADALKNGNYRLVNEIRNKWREQTGSELPTDFKALVPIVSGEIAKAVVGSQNALADREELRAGLRASASPEQLSGVITGYKALMAGQLKGLRKQYEETTGKKNFDTRVRESTRKAILNDEAPKEGSKSPVVIDGYTIKEN